MDNRETFNKYLREYRKKTNNAATKKYEKTEKGFLMRVYRNMKSRVTGITKSKNHIYKGLSILSKKDFYNWSVNDKNFKNLFGVWKETNYKRKLTPSINRIDSNKGYDLNNIEWITFSENCSQGAKAKKGMYYVWKNKI